MGHLPLDAALLTVLDKGGKFAYNAFPFDPCKYHVSVHPAAILFFTNTREQMLTLQAICNQGQLFDPSPRYSLGNDNNLVGKVAIPVCAGMVSSVWISLFTAGHVRGTGPIM